jgi:hypothetical protein
MMRIPRCRARLEAMLFAQTYGERLAEVETILNVFDKAIHQMMTSSSFASLLAHLLVIGNRLNVRTAMASAQGFRLSALASFVSLRSAKSSNLTMLDFLVRFSR